MNIVSDQGNPSGLDGTPRRAARLLELLAEPQAYAVEAQAQGGVVAVQQTRRGIAVGSGSFPRAALDELIGRDLVEVRLGPSGRPRYHISEAGTAHLRRRAASKEDRFLAQHQELLPAKVEVGGVRTGVQRDPTESPLEWLRRRKKNGEPLIDAVAFEAGERLRRDLTLAQMLPSVTLNWSAAASPKAAGGTGQANPTETAIAARQRATKALDSVGADFSGLLLDLCGFLKGLERIEQERGWPPRSGKVVVKLALARLASHYGLQGSARGPAASRGIRTWRAVLEGGAPASD